MIKDWPEMKGIPPAVPLLLDEVVQDGLDGGELIKRLIKVLPELVKQSQFFLESSESYFYGETDPLKLEIYMDGALNIFNTNVGCSALDCRISAARQMVRSFSLLGDVIWITDFLTEKFIDKRDISEGFLLQVIGDALVLKELEPLVRAGLIKFRSPWRPICQACLSEFDRIVAGMTERSLEAYSQEFSVEEMKGGAYGLSTGNAYYPSMVLRVFPSQWLGARRIPDPEESKRNFVYSAIRSALWSVNEATNRNGVVFSNSSIAMAALAMRENELKNRRSIQLFDERHSIDVPWVSNLSAAQIVELRNEASKSLPAFRQMLGRHFLSTKNLNEQNSNDMMDELRDQAVDVRNELENTRKYSSRYWKSAYAVLGLGISVYGLGSGNVPAALGGLLPILQLLIQHAGGTEKDLDKLERRAGFVLVKAQDILRHAD
ncbi:hypothetical protein [Bordetella genomosp. 4]|uniref:hypothetical protein n=1 Tax=Bordetella genomosp. 4 TaxID=463044 RepID=UPI000B9EE989|nr:hypothetical protein [Bordetella genomosp. 4]